MMFHAFVILLFSMNLKASSLCDDAYSKAKLDCSGNGNISLAGAESQALLNYLSAGKFDAKSMCMNANLQSYTALTSSILVIQSCQNSASDCEDVCNEEGVSSKATSCLSLEEKTKSGLTSSSQNIVQIIQNVKACLAWQHQNNNQALPSPEPSHQMHFFNQPVAQKYNDYSTPGVVEVSNPSLTPTSQIAVSNTRNQLPVTPPLFKKDFQVSPTYQGQKALNQSEVYPESGKSSDMQIPQNSQYPNSQSVPVRSVTSQGLKNPDNGVSNYRAVSNIKSSANITQTYQGEDETPQFSFDGMKDFFDKLSKKEQVKDERYQYIDITSSHELSNFEKISRALNKKKIFLKPGL